MWVLGVISYKVWGLAVKKGDTQQMHAQAVKPACPGVLEKNGA